MIRFKYFLIFLFAFSSLVSNYKKYYMAYDEINLFNSVASSSFEFDDKYIKRISKKYPNLSSSGVPIKGLLGAYYVTHDSIRKGIRLLKDANMDNPYLGYPDMLLARVYEALGSKDSFNLYTNTAYKKLPNNSASYLLLSKKLIGENKIDSLSYFFNKISDRINDSNIWQIYLAGMYANKDNFEKLNIDPSTVESNARLAKQMFDDKDVRLISDYLIYGRETVLSNINKFEEAKTKYDKAPDDAISILEDVIIEIDDNYDYYEALIEMYFFNNNYNKVIGLFDKLKSIEMTQLKGNIIEIIAISYLRINDRQNGCPLALLLFENNYKIDQTLKLACQI